MIITAILATTAGFVAAHATAIGVAAELAFSIGLEIEEANKEHEKNEAIREKRGMTENRTFTEQAIDYAIDYAGPITYAATWLALGYIQELALIFIVTRKMKLGVFETIKALLLDPLQPFIAPKYTWTRLLFITLWPAYTPGVVQYARFGTV